MLISYYSGIVYDSLQKVSTNSSSKLFPSLFSLGSPTIYVSTGPCNWLRKFIHSSLIILFLMDLTMDLIANCRPQHFLAIALVTIVIYSGSNYISCISFAQSSSKPLLHLENLPWHWIDHRLPTHFPNIVLLVGSYNWLGHHLVEFPQCQNQSCRGRISQW